MKDKIIRELRWCAVGLLLAAVIYPAYVRWRSWRENVNTGMWQRAHADARVFARRLVAEEQGHGAILSTYCAREEHWRDGAVFRCRVSVAADPDDENQQPRVASMRCRPGNGCTFDFEAPRGSRRMSTQ